MSVIVNRLVMATIALLFPAAVITAQTHRIIMLIGDDLGDFIPCVRATPAAPCTEPATADSRQRKIVQFSAYWGNGWYILPNPMHGSWTSIPKP